MLGFLLAAAAGFFVARRYPSVLPQVGVAQVGVGMEPPVVGASPRHWIADAIKRPGQLHRDLGVPEGQRLPLPLVRWAAGQPGALGQRGRLALQLRAMNPHQRARVGAVVAGAPAAARLSEFAGLGVASAPLVGLKGGLAERYPQRAAAVLRSSAGRKALRRGTRVELEHTSDPRLAREIALDHLVEDPRYYPKLLAAGL